MLLRQTKVRKAKFTTLNHFPLDRTESKLKERGNQTAFSFCSLLLPIGEGDNDNRNTGLRSASALPKKAQEALASVTWLEHCPVTKGLQVQFLVRAYTHVAYSITSPDVYNSWPGCIWVATN